MYFAVCTGLTSNHFLDNTSDVCAVVSHANRYQALPLLFYFSLGRGESLGKRLIGTSSIIDDHKPDAKIVRY